MPAPQIEFVDPTPLQDATVVTYIGCPFSLTISAVEQLNHFDLEVEPRKDEFALPEHVIISGPTCSSRPDAAPLTLADGIGSCTAVSRTLSWVSRMCCC